MAFQLYRMGIRPCTLCAALALGMIAAPHLIHAQAKPASPAQQKGAAAPAAAPVSPMEKLPKVVALVNGQTITREKLAQECLRRFGPVVLDNLLNKYLILQACKAQGINITQTDVNNEIARTSNKFGLSTKLFLEAMEKERDITPEQYSSEIVWPMLALRALAADKIKVTPQEIDSVMQAEFGPKVQVRMIAVSQADKAQQLYTAATAAPDTFRRIAKEQSEDAASASVEGLLPPIRRNSGDDQLEKIAFQLKPNEISRVFQVGEMHVMLQCVRQLPATPPNPQMLPTIQQRIEDQLRDQRVGESANTIFASLQKKSELITVLGNRELEAKYPGVAGYLNREPIPMDQLAAECILRHGRPILKGEINRVLLTSALTSANKQIAQADIDAEVGRAADSMGFLRPDGTPDTDAWLKSILEEEGATLDLYIQDAVWPSVALKKLVQDTVQVTPEDLQKGFESNFGPRAEVLAIVLSNQRTAEDVWQQARKDLSEQSFGQLAGKYSVETVSRTNFGKVPAIRRHSGQPTLEKAAFDLKPGDISGVVALNEQYVVLYKQGETNPLVKDFEAVRPELQKELLEKKLRIAMQNQLDSMLKTAQIDNLLEQTAQAGAPSSVPTASSGCTKYFCSTSSSCQQTLKQMNAEQLRALQAPIKQQYRDDPSTARVVMHASGEVQSSQLTCLVDTSIGQVAAGLHPAAGGSGELACSGDMLLQALVACSGVTLSAVATALGIEIRSANITAHAEMDFRGTLGIDKSVPVGITSLSLDFEFDSPAEDAQLKKLVELTERYCVVLQTLTQPAQFSASFKRAS